MKKLVAALLFVVVLGLAIQSNTASANGVDQLPKVFKTFSSTIQK